LTSCELVKLATVHERGTDDRLQRRGQDAPRSGALTRSLARLGGSLLSPSSDEEEGDARAEPPTRRVRCVRRAPLLRACRGPRGVLRSVVQSKSGSRGGTHGSS
jgi:hypothetical protein